MSQIKKNDSNPIANLVGSIGKEFERMGTETARHVTESINEVSKGVKDGGVVGGTVAFFDKISLGTMVAGAVDVVIPGADLPKPLAEGIASTVNLLSGNPLGYVDLVQSFMALSDGGKAASAPDGKAPAGQRMQTPESPAQAHHQAIVRPAPRLPVPDRLGGSIVTQAGGQILVTGTNKADTITVNKQADGNVKVTVNGESMMLTAEQAKNLVIAGNRGDDKITVGPGLSGVMINAGAGNDAIVVSANGATIAGGDGNDSITVVGKGNVLKGGAGDDNINMRGNRNRADGGAGNDAMTFRGNYNVGEGGDGDDRMRAIGNHNLLIGGKGDDTLRTAGMGNRAIGGPGQDTVTKTPGSLIERARDHIGDGFASIGDLMSGNEIADLSKPGKPADTAQKKLADMEKQAAAALSELDKILNNPDLSFEDMVFMLMTALMKQSQAEVKGMTKDIRDDKEKFETAKIELNAKFDAAEEKVLGLEAKLREKPDDKDAAKALGTAKSDLRKLGEDRNDKFSDHNDSRQEQLEALKNAMNKITEMQQALSNVLNSMHQTAMNTIGNIR